jgi:hypothetical protein
MKKENKYNILPILFIGSITVLLFWQFFIKSLVPYPSNYMLAWYEPWKSTHTLNQTITIAHKAVADDTFRQLLPYRLLTAQALQHFELPLWNPYNGAGMPLMATMHSGFLNPFNVFFLIFPAHIAWSWHIITQFILLCFFTYLYCRSINLGIKASLFTVSVFALSGFIIARLIFGEYVYVLAGLPLLLYLIEIYNKSTQTKKVFLIPLTIFFLFISGQPQMIFYVMLFSVCYAIWRIKGLHKLLVFFLHILIGIGLGGIQLLPTFELYQHASISTDSSKFIFDRFLLPLQHLVTILIPNYFGNQGTYNYWGAGDYIETVATVGSIPCFFAFLSLWKTEGTERSLIKFYATAALLTTITTLDWSGTRLFFSLPIPIISTGIPTRIFVLTSFSIAILAGFGFERWIKEKNFSRSLIYQLLPFLIVITAIAFYTIFLFLDHAPCPGTADISCRTVALRNTLFESIIFIFFLALFFLYLLKKKFFTNILPLLILALVTFLGVYNADKFLPFSSKYSFLPQNALITTLQKQTTDGRVFGFDEANIKTDFATLYHFFDPNYYDPLHNKRYAELVSFANTGTYSSPLLRSDVEIINNARVTSQEDERRKRLFDLLGVNYFIYKNPQSNELREPVWRDSNWILAKNQNALPRAYFVQSITIENNDKKILETLFSPNFNPKTTAILEESPRVSFLPSKNTFKSSVKIISYKENAVQLEATTDKPAFLILSDNYYPGWRAAVDKNTVPLYRANYTFRGVYIPQGTHTVFFKYMPNSLLLGCFITSISSLLLIALFLINRKRRTSHK